MNVRTWASACLSALLFVGPVMAQEPFGIPGPPVEGDAPVMGPASAAFQGPAMDYGGPMLADGSAAPVAPRGGFIRSSAGTFYFRGEAFMMRRSNHKDERTVMANSDGSTFSTGDLNFRNETGQRIHPGYAFNEVAAFDFCFWEIQDWNPQLERVGGGVTYTLPGSLATTSSAFTNATNIQVINRTMMKNYELNYSNGTIFNGLSVLGGFRYIDMLDRYSFVMSNGTGSSNYLTRVTDRLLGGQIGATYIYHLDLWSLEFIGKSGLYDNGASSSQFANFLPAGGGGQNIIRDTRLTPQQAHSIAAVNEVQIAFSRRLGNHFRLRAGYNAMWITNTVLAADQLDFTTGFNPATAAVKEGGDLFLYGVNVGLEARY